MAPRLVVAIALAAIAIFRAPSARAWQEAHQTGDDVTIHVDGAGGADVQHHVKWHVVRGPLKFIDIVNVEASATVAPDVAVTTDNGKTLGAHAARHDARTVRVTIDDPRAVMRGNFEFDVDWHVDLVAARALARDGATWRLAWSAPVATDGFDAAKTVFELPAAPEPPAAIVADTGAVDDAVVSSLRREDGLDVLELVRPHVARGEAPLWTLRVDPRALPLVIAPALRPPSEVLQPPEPNRVREATEGAALLALGAGFGLLVWTRARAKGPGNAQPLEARALLPLPVAATAAIAGAALAVAVALQVTGRTTLGAACIALATLAAARRARPGRPAVRGPGRWLVLQADEAFARASRRSARVAVLVVAGLAALGAAAAVARSYAPDGPWLVAIDAIALLPLLMTGPAANATADGARRAAPWLARLHARLTRLESLRTRPWARVPLEASCPDELRLLVLPRSAMPGVVGIEVGLGSSATPTGWASSPEVLARFLDGSPAASRLATAVPGVRSWPGRRPDERVVRLPPRRPSHRHTAGLVQSLAELFTDRRVEIASWDGLDRRSRVPLPRGARAAGPPGTLVAASNPG